MMQKVVKNTVRNFRHVNFGPIMPIRKYVGVRQKRHLLLWVIVLIVLEDQNIAKVNRILLQVKLVFKISPTTFQRKANQFSKLV